MAIDTMTTAAALVKKTYDTMVREVAFRKSQRPFLSLVKKNATDGGASFDMAIQYGDETGISATPSTAIANPGSMKFLALTVSQATHFLAGQINGRLAENAREKGPQAFANVVKQAMASGIEQFANDVETCIFQKGGGVIGKVASSSGLSTTLTLDDPMSYVNFFPGQIIGLTTAETGGSVRTGTVTVNAINGSPDGSTLTLSAALSTITSAATGDFIIQQGDADAKIKGLPAWNPTTAPTGAETYFYSADRSPDVAKLAGSRVDVSGRSLWEGLAYAAAVCGNNGGDPDTVFINPIQHFNLAMQASSKRMFTTTDADLGFETLIVHGTGGPIRVVPAPKCPGNRAHFVKMSDWELRSTPLGFGGLKDRDTMPLQRRYDDDNYEFRIAGYGSLVCYYPVNNCVATLASPVA